MLRLKRHTATALLLTFALGGFVGPVVHRFHHATENGSAHGVPHDHAHPERGDATLTKVAASEIAPLDCYLCASLVYVAGLSPRITGELPPNDGITADHLFSHSSLHRAPDRARAPPELA